MIPPLTPVTKIPLFPAASAKPYPVELRGDPAPQPDDPKNISHLVRRWRVITVNGQIWDRHFYYNAVELGVLTNWNEGTEIGMWTRIMIEGPPPPPKLTPEILSNVRELTKHLDDL